MFLGVIYLTVFVYKAYTKTLVYLIGTIIGGLIILAGGMIFIKPDELVKNGNL